MKTMVRALLTCIIITVIFNPGNYLHSQSLQFCEDVSQSGAPIKAGNIFYINDKGGYIDLLTTLPYRVGTKEVTYEIYAVDTEGNESYDNTIHQDVDESLTWFYKEITFMKAGRFNVYVYDGDRNFLTSSQVTIQYY
jgi:hypothetical protein